MKTYVANQKNDTGKGNATPARQQKTNLDDHRPSALLAHRLSSLADNSARTMQAYALAPHDLRPSLMPLQRHDAAVDSTKLSTADAASSTGQRGLPASIRSGIEALSGYRMDHVQVHYNSSRPAQLNAHAYAQGSEIHLAPGQEKHLPHEAWHVVQQAQGRVAPTMQMNAVAINDDRGLENEADVMGAKALQTKLVGEQLDAPEHLATDNIVQPVWNHSSRFGGFSTLEWDKVVGNLKWFYNTLNEKYSYIADQAIPQGDLEHYKLIHDNSYLEKTWDEWQVLTLPPPRQYRKQDDSTYSPEIRYEYVKREKGYNPSTNQGNLLQINQALDEGLLEPTRQIFEALQAKVSVEEQRKVSLNNVNIYGRIVPVFRGLKTALSHNKLDPSSDLHGKLSSVMAPVGKYSLQAIGTLPGSTVAKLLKSLSEALSELEYAAVVTGNGGLKQPFVLGAQGPVWSPQQREAPSAEVKHGNLPPLDVLRLEVDGYYQTSDGVLHADEVKDSPRAMAEKLKAGEQVGRQAEWLEKPAINERTGARYAKQVGYYIQATGPYFDSVLDKKVLSNLALIEDLQDPGLKFIRIGSQSLSLMQLSALEKHAMDWLDKSKPALFKMGIKLAVAAQTYFGDLNTTLKSLRNGPLKEE